jgi:putative sterol carrier protein
MLEGGDGVIIVDTLESAEAAFPVKEAFTKITAKPAKSANVDTVAGFRFPDTKEAFTVHVRRCVAEIQPKFPDNPDLVLTVDSNVWKEIAAGVRNPTLAFFKDMDKEGGIVKLMKFLALFK